MSEDFYIYFMTYIYIDFDLKCEFINKMQIIIKCNSYICNSYHSNTINTNNGKNFPLTKNKIYKTKHAIYVMLIPHNWMFEF